MIASPRPWPDEPARPRGQRVAGALARCAPEPTRDRRARPCRGASRRPGAPASSRPWPSSRAGPPSATGASWPTGSAGPLRWTAPTA